MKNLQKLETPDDIAEGLHFIIIAATLFIRLAQKTNNILLFRFMLFSRHIRVVAFRRMKCLSLLSVLIISLWEILR